MASGRCYVTSASAQINARRRSQVDPVINDLAESPFLNDLFLMRPSVALLLYFLTLVILPGCRKRETSPPKPRDVCELITRDEIQATEESPITETKNSVRFDGGFRVSQCFYTASEPSKSVNLSLVERDPTHPGKRSPQDFWNEKFDPYRDEEPKTQNSEEKEQGPAPKTIEKLGDSAYWVGNRFGGILYVLKGDAFISVSVGGTDDAETKLKKSTALAQKALQRL